MRNAEVGGGSFSGGGRENGRELCGGSENQPRSDEAQEKQFPEIIGGEVHTWQVLGGLIVKEILTIFSCETFLDAAALGRFCESEAKNLS